MRESASAQAIATSPFGFLAMPKRGKRLPFCPKRLLVLSRLILFLPKNDAGAQAKMSSVNANFVKDMVEPSDYSLDD